MLIKDEPYVSAMLTSPEKYKRDQRRWKVNPARGDKITYTHLNRPEFVLLGKKIRFRWKSKDWQLRLMARATFMRDLLPKWHQREKDFRDWFIKLVNDFKWQTDSEYDRWLAALRTPEPVTGYREVRYPKMEAARAKAEAILSQTDDTPPNKPEVVVNLSDRIIEQTTA